MGHLIKAPMKLSDLILTAVVIIAFDVAGRCFSAAKAFDFFNEIIQVTEDMAENNIYQNAGHCYDAEGEQEYLHADHTDSVKQGVIIPEIQIIPFGIRNLTVYDKFLIVSYGIGIFQFFAFFYQLET